MESEADAVNWKSPRFLRVRLGTRVICFPETVEPSCWLVDGRGGELDVGGLGWAQCWRESPRRRPVRAAAARWGAGAADHGRAWSLVHLSVWTLHT